MDALKLLALDQDDLAIISAHVQDGVFKVGDISFSARAGQLSIVLNRFVWEKAQRKQKSFERRRAAITFKRVNAVRSIGFDRSKREEVLSLLAIRFVQDGDGPEGRIEVLLSGGGTISMDVEVIEVQLADTGGAWETGFMPSHPGN
ncbi:DUF2948 family protein [Agrobacterium sp. ES01]|uniref:DUF2948 family protein n=1 Tax=Agrobacterium sp. ES01 TaxID=3420714 RepID=UPI003D0B46CA